MTQPVNSHGSSPLSSAWGLDAIHDFWTEQAQQHGAAAEASWTDVRVMEMEVRELLRHVTDGDRVLDVGCANGFSTLQLAQARQIDIVGVDYVAEMIDAARARLAELRPAPRNQVRFETGNAMRLQFADNTFDKVIVIRVIINLGQVENQLAALRECVRVLKPGGLLIASEATRQGWQNLNRLREEWGLPAIGMPPFNNYLDQDQVCQALDECCTLEQINDFASSYYVGTRVLKPLLGKLTGREQEVANPLSEINRWFAQLPSAGDYGTQKMFLFRKRG